MAQTAEEFADELVNIAGQLDRGYEPLLESFIPVIRADVQSNFDNAQTAGGQAWPRRKDSKPHPLLKLSGALEAASVGTGANHIEEISNNELTFGVRGVPYAAVQQEGGGNNIPAREYMAVSEDTVDQLAEMAADFQLKRFMERN